MNQASTGRRGLLRAALCVAAVVSAFAAPSAFAAGTGTDPDMPTFVPNAAVVGQGDIQFETGVTRTQDGDGSALLRMWSTPTLLRFGMPSNYEIRIQTNAFNRVRTYSTVNNGMGDLSLGFKAAIPQTMNPNMSLAVVAQAAFPSGSDKINNHGFRPEAQFMGQIQLPNANTIGGVVGLRYDMDQNDERYKSGVIAANFGHTWNPQWTSYLEAGVRPWLNARRGGKNAMYGIGSAWRPMPATQLNATVGFGVKENDTDLAWTIGVSRRFTPSTMSFSHKQDQKQDGQTPSATSEDGK